MRVLVTGNMGYIGTVMVPILQEKGFDVVGLDSELFDARAQLSYVGNWDGRFIIPIPEVKVYDANGTEIATRN